jgi:26S proteasome regulatory subunit T5
MLQLLDVDPEEDEEEGANIDLNSQRKGKCAVIKTSTRQVLIYNSFSIPLRLTVYGLI